MSRILFVNLGIGGGGAERVMVDLITHWNAQESSVKPKNSVTREREREDSARIV